MVTNLTLYNAGIIATIHVLENPPRDLAQSPIKPGASLEIGSMGPNEQFDLMCSISLCLYT